MRIFWLVTMFPAFAFAQLPTYHWSFSIGDSYSDEVLDIQEDQSGNAYSVGFFCFSPDLDYGNGSNVVTTAGGNDGFVIKSDVNGNYVWAFAIGGIGGDQVTSLDIDAMNNIIIAGEFSGVVDFDPGPGTYNMNATANAEFFVAKYDGNANLIWAIEPVSGANGYCRARDLVVDYNGDIIICGDFSNTVDFDPSANNVSMTATAMNDIFIAKYNSSGALIWVRTVGGNSADLGYSVAVDNSNNLVITGQVTGAVDIDPGSGVQMINASGTGLQIFLLSLDPNGNYNWAFDIGDPTGGEIGYAVETDPNDNIIVTGMVATGGDFDPGIGVQNLITPNANTNTLFLAKYTSSGQYIWAFLIPDVMGSLGRNLDVDAQGNIAVTGYYATQPDFDPGSGVHTINASQVAGDAFLAKYTPSGNYVYAIGLSGTSGSYGYAVRFGINDGIYWGGQYSGLKDFDPNAGTAAHTDNGKWDAFAAHYYDWGKTDIYQTEPQSLNVFVDPFTGELVCQMGGQTTCNHICVTDVLGRVVYKGAIGVGETRINTSQWMSGNYLISVVGSDLGLQRKVIITH